MVIIIKFF